MIGRKLLFPCGDLRRNELENGLKLKNIILEQLICYKTVVKSPDIIEKAIEEVVQDFKADFVAFFSPSGVNATYEILKQRLKSFKCVAIGPTSAEALASHGCKEVLVASEPCAESVMEAAVKQLT